MSFQQPSNGADLMLTVIVFILSAYGLINWPDPAKIICLIWLAVCGFSFYSIYNEL